MSEMRSHASHLVRRSAVDRFASRGHNQVIALIRLEALPGEGTIDGFDIEASSVELPDELFGQQVVMRDRLRIKGSIIWRLEVVVTGDALRHRVDLGLAFEDLPLLTTLILDNYEQILIAWCDVPAYRRLICSAIGSIVIKLCLMPLERIVHIEQQQATRHERLRTSFEHNCMAWRAEERIRGYYGRIEPVHLERLVKVGCYYLCALSCLETGARLCCERVTQLDTHVLDSSCGQWRLRTQYRCILALLLLLLNDTERGLTQHQGGCHSAITAAQLEDTRGAAAL
mmetsp:Transcript_33367/g.87858  ORF Transcript_33367/g.87858 Transcript_33367/m.87858 type:complete len:285 (+) Transcript_33367:140-994(+)